MSEQRSAGVQTPVDTIPNKFSAGRSQRLACGHHVIDLSTPCVMGVLNITPDSFSDRGDFFMRDAALRRAEQMVEEGAAVIDVGGESTRPGATAVSAAAELLRVLPVVEALASRLPVPISVDTSKPEVMRAAADAGATLINDVCALRTPGALDAAAGLRLPVCLMHMQGEPRTMQVEPCYNDVVSDVRAFLSERVSACIAAGMCRNQLLIDPGFGFGKRLAHNLALLARLDELAQPGVHVLVGLSRKSMLGALTGRAVDERLAAGLSAAVIAACAGARMLRVHDVAATVDALRVVAAVATARPEGAGADSVV